MNAEIVQRNGPTIKCHLSIHSDRIIIDYKIRENDNRLVIYRNLIYKFKISLKNPNIIKLSLYNFHHFKIAIYPDNDKGNDNGNTIAVTSASTSTLASTFTTNNSDSNSNSNQEIISKIKSLNSTPRIIFDDSTKTNPTSNVNNNNDSNDPSPATMIEDYTVIRDYERLFGNDSRFRLSAVNLDYSMSPSYPSRIIVPSTITDECLLEASKFRVHGISCHLCLILHHVLLVFR